MRNETHDLPAINRPDITSALVEFLTVDNRGQQESTANAIISHWRSSEWPAGLVSLSCYVSSDDCSVLTYAQWSSDSEMWKAVRHQDSIVRGEQNWSVSGVKPGGPVPFRLYRVVHGGKVTDPAPVPECFPAAVFPMKNAEAARQWIDNLLSAEEETEGKDREYPGALAANFHVSLDGTSVLVLSEWVSEEEAATHIDEVIRPLLEQAGGGDAGARYQHRLTLFGLEA